MADHRSQNENRHNSGGRRDRPLEESSGRYKRRREDEESNNNTNRSNNYILAATVKLCNKGEDGDTDFPPREQIERLHRSIVREANNRASELIEIILDSAEELSHKVPVYAALIGLLNTEETEFVAELVSTARERCEQALAKGDRNKARLVVRLLAALVPSNVVFASSMLKVLLVLVEAAVEVADTGGTSRDEQRIWQPYADYLVYITLMALPWGGSELAESAPAEMEKLLAEVEKYMQLRPSSHTAALQPFFEGDDAASMSDSGAASFLGQVWEAVQEMQKSGKWQVESIPNVVNKLDEAQLATGRPHSLEPWSVPKSPPCLSAAAPLPPLQAAAAVLAAYPPRGGIRLLPPENTWGDKAKIERLIAEEYFLDTIFYFEADRVECAKTLAFGLPLEGKWEPILTETIFSQMMRVPTPHLKPIAYATILADLCRLLQGIPRSMSACMREFFVRMPALDPQLRSQLADWLAYHLSNFDFMWPWAKWAYVLQAPVYNAQRRFVVELLARLIRLSYYGNIMSKVPENYRVIFPPKPEPQPLDDSSESLSTSTQTEIMSNASAAERKWAASFITLVKEKKTVDESLAWISDNNLEEELGGKISVLKMVLRSLLIAGSKSFTHMLIALERFDDLLTSLLAETGERGQVALVSTAADVWQAAPQRASQAIDRLMAHRLVGGDAITRWAFGYRGLLSLESGLANGLAWEALYNAVNKTLARSQDAKEELQAAIAATSTENIPKSNGVKESRASHDSGGAPQMLEFQDDRAIAKQQEVAAKETELAEALEIERSLFVLCFEHFRDLLTTHKLTDSSNSEASKEWFNFTLASLRAFTRKYHAAVAPLSRELEEKVFEEADPLIKQAFVDSVHI